MATRQRDYRGKVYDPSRGVVHVFTTLKYLPAWLTDTVDERTRIEHHHGNPPPGSSADWLVGTGALSSTFERRAGRLLAIPVVMPEAADWLRNKIRTTTEAGGRDVVIVIHSPSDVY